MSAGKIRAAALRVRFDIDAIDTSIWGSSFKDQVEFLFYNRKFDEYRKVNFIIDIFEFIL